MITATSKSPPETALLLHQWLCEQYEPATVMQACGLDDASAEGWWQVSTAMNELRAVGMAIAVGLDGERRELWVALDGAA